MYSRRYTLGPRHLTFIGFSFFFVIILIGALFYIRSYRAEFKMLNLVMSPLPTLAPPTTSSNTIVAPQPVTIMSTGDVMLGRSVNYLGWRQQNYGWSLANISNLLSAADWTVINLETPIIDDCPLTNEGMIFCADASAAAAVAASGIDLATLANNHIYNYGDTGFVATQTLLAAAQVESVTAADFYQTTINGQTFGWLAADDVSTPLDETAFQAQVAAKSQLVDVLFVSLHFGGEYRYEPTTRQQELAHLAIDAGAAVVLGNHSHWLGPIESYHQGVIVYSQGNLVFDQMWSLETRQGIVIGWQFQAGQLTQLTIYPIWITDYGLANLATGDKAQTILTTLTKISSNFSCQQDNVFATESATLNCKINLIDQ